MEKNRSLAGIKCQRESRFEKPSQIKAEDPGNENHRRNGHYPNPSVSAKLCMREGEPMEPEGKASKDYTGI
jgi:hypothetical protein